MAKVNSLWQDELEAAQSAYIDGLSTKEQLRTSLDALGYDSLAIEEELVNLDEIRYLFEKEKQSS